MIGKSRLLVPLMLVCALLATALGWGLRQWVSAVPRRLGPMLTQLEHSADFAGYGRALEQLFQERAEFRVFAEILWWPGQPQPASAPAPLPPERQAARLQDHKMSLLKLCRQGRYTTAQCDLLLALLLERDGHHTTCARLLELLRAEGRGSAAVDAVLALAYTQLGRSPTGPRESPGRDRLAVW